jgi:magnesium transporter
MNITVFDSQGAQTKNAAELPVLLKQEDCLIWVDLTGPDQDDVRLMREVFQFHPLAIEDTYNHHQRPKIEEYPNHLFMIMNTVRFVDGELEFRELDVFVGRSYIVTVHADDNNVIKEVVQRMNHSLPAASTTPTYLLYVIADTVVDGYFPIMDQFESEIAALEEAILLKPQAKSLDRLFQLKRMLVNMWRVVWPQRDALGILNSHNLALIDQQAVHYYLRDVSDHLIWIADMVNTFRDTLTSVADLYMSSVSNRLNRTVNRLTIFTLVIGIFTVISGFYGMNFEKTWPPFTDPMGVPFVLLLMVLGASVLLSVVWWMGRE